MHPVQLTNLDMDLLREAKKTRDWKVLTTWKQRYLFQRCIALRERDFKSIEEIAKLARKELGK
jgi:hypothetical protein